MLGMWKADNDFERFICRVLIRRKIQEIIDRWNGHDDKAEIMLKTMLKHHTIQSILNNDIKAFVSHLVVCKHVTWVYTPHKCIRSPFHIAWKYFIDLTMKKKFENKVLYFGLTPNFM